MADEVAKTAVFVFLTWAVAQACGIDLARLLILCVLADAALRGWRAPTAPEPHHGR